MFFFSVICTKRANPHELLFASVDNAAFPEKNQLLNEKAKMKMALSRDQNSR